MKQKYITTDELKSYLSPQEQALKIYLGTIKALDPSTYKPIVNLVISKIQTILLEEIKIFLYLLKSLDDLTGDPSYEENRIRKIISCTQLKNVLEIRQDRKDLTSKLEDRRKKIEVIIESPSEDNFDILMNEFGSYRSIHSSNRISFKEIIFEEIDQYRYLAKEYQFDDKNMETTLPVEVQKEGIIEPNENSSGWLKSNIDLCNYLGIDLNKKYYLKIVQRMQKNGLNKYHQGQSKNSRVWYSTKDVDDYIKRHGKP